MDLQLLDLGRCGHTNLKQVESLARSCVQVRPFPTQRPHAVAEVLLLYNDVCGIPSAAQLGDGCAGNPAVDSSWHCQRHWLWFWVRLAQMCNRPSSAGNHTA